MKKLVLCIGLLGILQPVVANELAESRCDEKWHVFYQLKLMCISSFSHAMGVTNVNILQERQRLDGHCDCAAMVMFKNIKTFQDMEKKLTSFKSESDILTAASKECGGMPIKL